MDKQKYLKLSSNDELDAKKYSFELQRKNHFICQNKWSLIGLFFLFPFPLENKRSVVVLNNWDSMLI